MSGNPVGWFEIYVNEMSRAKKFYESVFKTTLERLDGGDDAEVWSFPGNMTSYGAPGALVKMKDFPVGMNSVIIYFSCEDCSVQEKMVTQFGGKIEKAKMSIGQYGFISIVSDTEGNMFGLHSQK